MKKCNTCGLTKPFDDYYAQPGTTPNGRQARCKECTKRAVRINYRQNKEHYQAYDRSRTQSPERKAKACEYQRRRRVNQAEKYKARYAVGNAVRDGRLVVQPCEVCGSAEVQAHHEDYSKPLEVMWLCFEHHRARHGQQADATDGVRTLDATKRRREAA